MSWQEFEKLIEGGGLEKLTPEKLQGGFLEGKTVQEQLGVSDALVDEMYAIAKGFLDERRYHEASDCFFFLVGLDPFVSEFWLRLGNAEHMQGRAEEALHAYSFASLTDADDPSPHLYSAQLYAHLGERAKAERCLAICKRLIDGAPEFEPLRGHVEEVSLPERKK